jgi:hypothetical protein
MEEDRTQPLVRSKAANDNALGEAEGCSEITPLQKLDRVVLDIAGLIGRQMAREDFERLRASAANENQPRRAADGGSEADRD